MKPHDLRLYFVTDPKLIADDQLEEVVLAAVKGGATCVQLRDKQACTRSLVSQARRLLKHLKPRGIPLVVNDRVDVALAAGAQGVHLGQSDMTVADARRLVGTHLSIGLSVEALDQVDDDADYLAVSPVFSTPTKTDCAPPLGLAGLRSVARISTRPVIGIGGIGLHNIADVFAAGAAGAAVVSAIASAKAPEQAARKLRDLADTSVLEGVS